MKKAVYTLTAFVLAVSLAGCAGTGLIRDDLIDGDRPAGTDYPTVSASPAVVTPDVEDGVVRDDDGIITDDDTGAAATPRPDAGKKTEGNGKTASPSPSASPEA